MQFTFRPKTIYRKYSEFSGADVVVLETAKRRVMGVSHINYSLWSSDTSDDFEDRYWGNLLQILKIKIPQKKLDKVLILGLAGGTMAYLIDKHYHPDVIVGVELDPIVIEAGEKYFYLKSLPSLRVVEGDAVVWLEKAIADEKQDAYDLIVLDIFHQEFTPEECDTKDFYRKISKLLADNGILVLNKIYKDKVWKQQVHSFISDKLSPYFDTIEVERQKRPLHLDNALFCARHKKE